MRSSDVPPRSVTVRRTPLNSRFCFCFCFFLFGLVSWSFYSRAGSVSPSSRVRVFPSRRGGPAPRRQRTRNRRWETDPRPMRQHDREEKATAYGVLDSSASVGGEIFQNRKTVCNPARRIRRKRGLNEKRRRVQTVFSHAEFYSPPPLPRNEITTAVTSQRYKTASDRRLTVNKRTHVRRHELYAVRKEPTSRNRSVFSNLFYFTHFRRRFSEISHFQLTYDFKKNLILRALFFCWS